ncbi:hypothetical protein L5515_010096 [Caenorhabditis briggsae]|uniref:Homeobox domain-containing protein n=1 Tax=Caenorhabditis briggsae TaxID=6238 RepID=A0AAE9JDP2_CAEBR|nr:hypothetical protein L5515_010096 [Caenorhabditis briggsae]
MEIPQKREKMQEPLIKKFRYTPVYFLDNTSTFSNCRFTREFIKTFPEDYLEPISGISHAGNQKMLKKYKNPVIEVVRSTGKSKKEPIVDISKFKKSGKPSKKATTNPEMQSYSNLEALENPIKSALIEMLENPGKKRFEDHNYAAENKENVNNQRKSKGNKNSRKRKSLEKNTVEENKDSYQNHPTTFPTASDQSSTSETKKVAYTKFQLATMREMFEKHEYPELKTLEVMAENLKLDVLAVQNYFNRRRQLKSILEQIGEEKSG